MGCCSCTNLKKSYRIDEDPDNNNENRISTNMDMNKQETPKIKNYSLGNAIPFKPPELKCDSMPDNTKGDEFEEMFKMIKNKESESSVNLNYL